MAYELDVANEAALRTAISTINGGSVGTTINFTGSFQLAQSLPMITSSVTVTDNGNTLDANSAGRAFFVQAGTVSISNGGAGGGLGGGGHEFTAPRQSSA